MTAGTQLSLEDITRMTHGDLWYARGQGTDRPFYRFSLTEGEARQIILEIISSLHQPPAYELEDQRQELDGQKLFTRFVFPYTRPATQQSDNLGPDERAFVQRLSSAHRLPYGPTKETFATVYYIDGTSDGARKMEGNKLIRPPADKKVLFINITDIVSPPQKELLVMNAFYTAYAKIKGMPQQ